MSDAFNLYERNNGATSFKQLHSMHFTAQHGNQRTEFSLFVKRSSKQFVCLIYLVVFRTRLPGFHLRTPYIYTLAWLTVTMINHWAFMSSEESLRAIILQCLILSLSLRIRCHRTKESGRARENGENMESAFRILIDAKALRIYYIVSFRFANETIWLRQKATKWKYFMPKLRCCWRSIFCFKSLEWHFSQTRNRRWLSNEVKCKLYWANNNNNIQLKCVIES